jgi:hypothetical protein
MKSFERKIRQSELLGECVKMKYSVLLISVVVTVILVIILFVVGTVGIINATDYSFGTNTNPSYSLDTINTRGPNYFFPYADVYTYVYSPYAKYIENFTFYESTDNSTWFKVPISDTKDYIKIGTASLNGFSTTIYQKIYFQYENITIQNQTVSTADMSFVSQYYFSSLPTPQTLVIFILLTIAVFSFVLQIVDFLFRDEAKIDSSTSIRTFQVHSSSFNRIHARPFRG